MSEVSGRILGLFRQIAGLKGVTVERIFEGTNCPAVEGKDPEFISWSDFCVLCRNAAAVCGGLEQLGEMGAEVFGVPALGGIVGVVRLIASPQTLYWASKKWSGPALFLHLGNEIEWLPGGRLRFIITIPPAHEDCPEFFYLNAGVLRTLPRLLRMHDAYVELSLSPNKCVYTIDPPPSLTLWARLRRAFSILFSARTAIEELGAQQSLLAQRYKELQAARQDVVVARDEAIAARIAAEKALAVKSQFLATMSHEFRTPLNGVLGMTELLIDTKLDEEQSSYADTIRTCGKHLLALVNDVLDYAKLEASRVAIASVAFNVRDAVETVLEMMSGQARAQGLEIGVSFGALPSIVESDPQRLQQALLNLIGNALKFTNEGSIFVEVEEIEHHEQTSCLRFTVRDTGIGIPDDFLPQLFVPFTQVDGSNSRKYGGTGLGLAITREIVEALGGSIEVESKVGVGSVFRFTICARIPSVEAPEGETLPMIGPYRALVVDDNPEARLIIGRSLERWGLEVECVEDGRQALAALSARKFDLVVLDFRLPGMDGFELATEIIATLGVDRPNLMMVTASGDRSHAQIARDIGITTYLTKPFRLRHLHAAIAELLASKPKAAAALAKAPRDAGAAAQVLVVDDNPINLRVARAMLRSFGAEATGASSGSEAIALAKERRFDLIFMDIEMPEMDGFETTRALRALECTERTPIVALTAHATNEIRARTVEVGMNDFVSKPPTIETLRKVTEHWLTASIE